jgi:3-methyladenine DNA glycosylase AlkC
MPRVLTLSFKMGNISRLSSACLQMTLSYLIKMMNLSKKSFDILTIYEKASGSKVILDRLKITDPS